MNKQQKKQTRVYKRITPRTVANHAAQVMTSGNNTAAVRDTDAIYKDHKARGHRIATKSNTVSAAEYIEDQLQQIGSEAIERVRGLVQSDDERIATKNAHYAIDHIRGKAVQRNISASVKLNIQSVLD